MRHGTWAPAAIALSLCATAGCANADNRRVAAVASSFYQAVASGDAATACDLLAPATKSELEQSEQKPCEDAVLGAGIPDAGQPDRTRVFGTMAQVELTGDTAFLAEFQGGWKVMAVGCTARPELPYDCEVSG